MTTTKTESQATDGAKTNKKRYAICGVSGRAMGMFILPLHGVRDLPEYGDFSAHGEVVALLDIDPSRPAGVNKNFDTNIPCFGPDNFDRMIDQTRPDFVVVTGSDYTHAHYILKGLEHDVDVICEKPMVIDCGQARAVIEAEKKSRASVRVTFNYRYTQAHMALKRLIMEGTIGRVTNIEFVYNLDTCHGASYFTRWNRDRARSGGLCIHKCCHHFDLINWFIDDEPQQVFAYGALNYYGAESPYNPSKIEGRDYSIEEQKSRCPYHQRWHAGHLTPPADDHLFIHNRYVSLPRDDRFYASKGMYIYDPQIDVEDTYSAVVRYKGGASMSYSCNFSTPWEGYILAFNGTKGRLETREFSQPSRCPFPVDERQTITVLPLFGERQIHEVPHHGGGHGGADPVLKHDLFVEQTRDSKDLHMVAGTRAGAMAVAIGEGVWRSIAESRPIDIEEMLGA